MSLLQIYYRVRQWKKFENRLIFGEVMGKSLVSCFLLTHGVEIPTRRFSSSILWITCIFCVTNKIMIHYVVQMTGTNFLLNIYKRVSLGLFLQNAFKIFTSKNTRYICLHPTLWKRQFLTVAVEISVLFYYSFAIPVVLWPVVYNVCSLLFTEGVLANTKILGRHRRIMEK